MFASRCGRLRRAPLFTTLAVLSIALGIGANTAVFTLVDQVVLRPLPIPAPDQLVQLRIDGTFSGNTWGDGSELSYPMYQDLRDRNTAFSGVCARFEWPMHLSGGGATERVNGELVSGTYFPVLGVGSARGRVITPADDRGIGGHPVAVLSFDYWTGRFNSDPRIVGRKILLNGQPFTIIGVSRRGFHGIDIGYATQVFVPMMMKPQMTPGWNFLDERRSRFARVFARLRPGVTAERAAAGLQPFFRAMRQEEMKDPSFTTASAYAKREFMRASLQVVPAAQGHSGLRDFVTRPLWTLMAIVTGVLLIACANVAGLLIARGMARQREIAIRIALGGSRLRVVLQLLVETLVLSFIGAVGGLVLATWGTSLILSFFVDDPASAGMLSGSLDGRVLGFTVAIALTTAIVCGLVPALQATTPSLAPTLKDQAGTVVGGGPVRLRKALVVAQVALSLLLLIGAGLFVRSLRNLLAQDPGFRTSNLVAFTVDPSLNGYAPDRIKRLASRVIERTRTLPGVMDVSMASVPILSGGSWNSTVTVEGYAAREGENVVAYNNTVMPGDFQTLRIPLLRGRDFSERDARWTPAKEGVPDYRVAIANQEFVRRYFRGRDPIGRHVGFGNNPGTATPMEIIGVVGTAVGIRDEAEPQLFFPLLEDSTPRAFVGVRPDEQPTRHAVWPAARSDARPGPEPSRLRASHDDRQGERLAPDGAARRALVDRAQRVCHSPGGDRSLRRDGLHGDQTHARGWNPHGARCAVDERGVAVRARGRHPRRVRLSCWAARVVGVRPMGAEPAVRHRPAGPCHDRGGVAVPCGSSAGRRDGARGAASRINPLQALRVD